MSWAGITLAGRAWYLVMFTAQPATTPPNTDVAVTPHSWSRELTWALSRAIPWAFTRVWSCVHHFNSLHKLALTFPAHMRDALGIITKLVLTVAHFSNNPLKIHQVYKVFMNLKALECRFKAICACSSLTSLEQFLWATERLSPTLQSSVKCMNKTETHCSFIMCFLFNQVRDF